ncbi:signal peptidase I [Diaminobutyricibacter tongyongensis]|uniref:Signal peptidase I n=1 Tax=Leifsonia tongyongensis TaxID=1268043 RepID=A0A6L9XVB0_9MICO|nr:signal peptidase I [Diaminobutyricibacter tongyongensis]NEN04938.1 signal peptidase I [Diaminobutyricibacter tongyongensis]
MEASAAGAPAHRRHRHRRSRWRVVRDVMVMFVVAILVSFLVKTFLGRSFYIPSVSMERTLMVGDRILVDQFTPKVSGIQRGDIVVFRDPGGWLDPQKASAAWNPLDAVLTFIGLSAGDSDDYLIKRVIGLPGDHVSCCNALGQMVVNGAPLRESYLNGPAGTALPGHGEASLRPFSVTVPKGSLWVMGDNRDHSADSRTHQTGPGRGFVPIDNVVGKAFAITWPADRWSWLSSHPETFVGVN